MKIALDAMGGDYAPKNIILGAGEALQANARIEKLYLVGDTPAIEQELKDSKISDGRIEIVHSTQVVAMSDGAVESVRRKKDSSISRAVDLVKSGAADAVVSAGHTGAAVASTTIKLRTLPGIERPGIASIIPTEHNLFVLIDSGANVDARPLHLVHYAIMGAVYSKHVLGFPNPSIGLMSIGGEDVKGSDFTKEVFKLLKGSNLNFRGNVEGHDLFEHPVEVVVCDGFVGNVVLKTSEAIAEAIFKWLKNELKKSPLRLAGALMAQGAFRAIKTKTDWEEYGGSPLLGLNGTCIIAHGASSPRAIKNAIRVATESVEQGINPLIAEEVRKQNEKK